MNIEELIIKGVLEILKLFKGSIIKAEEKTPALLKIIKWADGIAADIDAYCNGKPLPDLKTGNSTVDGIADMILQFIADNLQAPQQLKNILDEISINALAILNELDSNAAQAYANKQAALLPAAQQDAIKKTIAYNGNARQTPAQKDTQGYIVHRTGILAKGKKLWEKLKADLSKPAPQAKAPETEAPAKLF